jgi:hypothetical protein
VNGTHQYGEGLKTHDSTLRKWGGFQHAWKKTIQKERESQKRKSPVRVLLGPFRVAVPPIHLTRTDAQGGRFLLVFIE